MNKEWSTTDGWEYFVSQDGTYRARIGSYFYEKVKWNWELKEYV